MSLEESAPTGTDRF